MNDLKREIIIHYKEAKDIYCEEKLHKVLAGVENLMKEWDYAEYFKVINYFSFLKKLVHTIKDA